MEGEPLTECTPSRPHGDLSGANMSEVVSSPIEVESTSLKGADIRGRGTEIYTVGVRPLHPSPTLGTDAPQGWASLGFAISIERKNTGDSLVPMPIIHGLLDDFNLTDVRLRALVTSVYVLHIYTPPRKSPLGRCKESLQIHVLYVSRKGSIRSV